MGWNIFCFDFFVNCGYGSNCVVLASNGLFGDWVVGVMHVCLFFRRKVIGVVKVVGVKKGLGVANNFDGVGVSVKKKRVVFKF